MSLGLLTIAQLRCVFLMCTNFMKKSFSSAFVSDWVLISPQVRFLLAFDSPVSHSQYSYIHRTFTCISMSLKVQQGNCHYQLLDKANGTPVSHRSKNGVVYLIPDWTSPAFKDPGSEVIQASLDQSTPALYYLFFRVSCYEGLPWHVTTNPQDFDVYPVGRQLQQVPYGDDSKLIFQHSFYVYISISKYPF